MSKEFRETYHLLKYGKDYRQKLFKEAFETLNNNLNDDNFFDCVRRIKKAVRSK